MCRGNAPQFGRAGHARAEVATNPRGELEMPIGGRASHGRGHAAERTCNNAAGVSVGRSETRLIGGSSNT
jgi:hypothetical protein